MTTHESTLTTNYAMKEAIETIVALQRRCAIETLKRMCEFTESADHLVHTSFQDESLCCDMFAEPI